MTALRSLTALAALALFKSVHAWNIELPPCTSPFRPFVYAGCFQDPGNPDGLSYRSPLDTQSMTIEKCMAECKGNGYRYAGLEYYGECFCGQTVNGKQLPESSCSYPCTGNKTEMCGGSDILSIYQDPTFLPVDQTTISDYVELGCYTDDSKLGRTLSFPMDGLDGSKLTTETCLTACKGKGYPFAGTEYSSQCWCGVVLANDTQKVDSSQCAMPCNGNKNQNCGGRAKLTLYVAKDLESLEPCGYVSSSSSSSSTTTSSSSTSSQPPPTTTPTTSPTTSPTSSPTSSSTSSTAPTTRPTSSTTCTTSSTTSPTSTRPTTSPTSTRPTTSPTSTTQPTTSPTSTRITTTSVPTTRPTTSALCTSTVTVPGGCEYGCGKWCSDDLPDWNDKDGCDDGQSHCKLQISDCLSNAGWPDALKCFEFAGWCKDITGYCGSVPKGGKCSKKDCFGQKPPKGGKPPKVTTTVVPCKPTSTSTKPTSSSTTSKCPIPTATGICKQPTSQQYGYGPGKPVGGIELPLVTCNDIKSDFNAGNQFKLYTNKESSKCGGYTRPKCSNACADACKAQYDQCSATYAQGCKENDSKNGGKWWRRDGQSYFDYATSPVKRTYGWTDNWNTAASKCTTQYKDCLDENKYVNANGKCDKYGSGW